MAFTLPTFNLTVNVWTSADIATAPTFTCLGNLTPGRRSHFAVHPGGTAGALASIISTGLAMELLVPALTDLRGAQNAGVVQVLEVPAGSARYYVVWFVDDIAKGFANEHRMALLKQIDFQLANTLNGVGTFGTIPAWPVPTP